jgi:hypothetical protein
MPDAFTSPLPAVEDVFDQEAPPEGPRLRPAATPVFPPAPAAAASPEPTREPSGAASGEPSAAPSPAPPPVPAAAYLAPPSYDEPPLPLGIAEPARPTNVRNLGAGRRDESDDEKAARARIPSWDDILLGIRRKD